MMTTSMGKTEWLNFIVGVACLGNFYLFGLRYKMSQFCNFPRRYFMTFPWQVNYNFIRT